MLLCRKHLLELFLDQCETRGDRVIFPAVGLSDRGVHSFPLVWGMTPHPWLHKSSGQQAFNWGNRPLTGMSVPQGYALLEGDQRAQGVCPKL